jgi:hypothetical protein
MNYGRTSEGQDTVHVHGTRHCIIMYISMKQGMLLCVITRNTVKSPDKYVVLEETQQQWTTVLRTSKNTTGLGVCEDTVSGHCD